MRKYRFRICNNQTGTMYDVEEQHCADDLDALNQAAEIWSAFSIEIHEGDTFVARVKPGNAPLDVNDPPQPVYPRNVVRLRAHSWLRRQPS